MKKAERKKWSKKKKIIVFGIIGVLVAVLLLNVIIMPLTASSPRVEPIASAFASNDYIRTETDISAHRAGGGEAPEETLSAFKLCMGNDEYRVDILEFDLHITKDGELILLHDDTLDRTSDAVQHFGHKKIKASEFTYAQIYELNMGENFCDPKTGEYPYKGLRGDDIPSDIRILSLDSILTYLEKGVRKDGTLRYIIEIKNEGDLGKKAMDKLYEKMQEYGILNRTVVGTFNNDVTKYIDDKYSETVTRSASIIEVLDFYYAFLYGVELSSKVQYDVLQIPYKFFVFDFGTKALVDYAHKYNIAVQYWTINEEKDIAHLSEIGADAIMTDYPSVAYTMLREEDK